MAVVRINRDGWSNCKGLYYVCMLYREFSYNIGGVITLEYAPFWLMGALISERILIGRLEQLHWVDTMSEDNPLNDDSRKQAKVK